MPLKQGLTAIYVSRKQIAAQQRAQARKKAQRDNTDQLQLDEETPE